MGPLGNERWYPAPAKINLFLHVVGRRDDGMHELQTAFQFLEFGDELHFQLRDDDRLVRAGVEFGGDDLVLRAARRLRDEAAGAPGVTIRLRKRIPVGGGLGGGSSDAATALVVLNRLWQLDLSGAELERLALELGADVPVFVRGQAAFAEGVGEQLAAVEPAESWYLLVDPGVSVSTAAVFADPQLTRDTPRTRISDFVAGRGRFANDCTQVVRRLHPPVAQVLDWLDGQARGRLSGTGGCVFAAFESRAEAAAARDRLPPHWTGWLARGANRSPLHRVLDTEQSNGA